MNEEKFKKKIEKIQKEHTEEIETLIKSKAKLEDKLKTKVKSGNFEIIGGLCVLLMFVQEFLAIWLYSFQFSLSGVLTFFLGFVFSEIADKIKEKE